MREPLGRRAFIGRSAAAVAATSVAGCGPEGGEAADEAGWTTGDAASRTDRSAALRAVAEAVLPSELGEDGTARAVAAFERWAEELEPVAELSHPYLVPELRYAGPDPRPGWAAQLDGLDKEALARHGVALGELDVAGRRALLEGPVGGAGDGDGFGRPGSAVHVAVALMAHFYASPEATDLCHGRVIGRQQCRGLDGAPDEPEALTMPASADRAPGTDQVVHRV